jgi:hypothetical protein
MSRRFAVLAGMCVLGAFAGVAAAAGPTGGGNPPPDGTPPYDPPPPGAACPVQESHAIPCRLWNVSCSPSSSSTVCTTTSVSGLSSASARRLALHLPRRYVAITLTCRTEKTDRITCRVVSKTSGGAVGTRIVVLRLPSQFAAVHISCRTSPRSGFACRLRK